MIHRLARRLAAGATVATIAAAALTVALGAGTAQAASS